MKLISCYIESFGGLSGFEKQFDAEFDSFFQRNGTGKTTLSAFILAMLYGLDSLRATDKELKDRARYLPWGGGKYGGSLTLESKGKLYRIERTFDSKSETKDTLTVYDLQSGEKILLPASAGEYFLGIPKDSFLATACFIGKEQGSLLGMMPRIGSYVEGINDTDLYDKALSALLKASKNYSKKNSGSIDKCKDEIKKCTAEKNRCISASALAEEYQNKLAECEKEQKPIKQRMTFLSKHAGLIEQQKLIETYKEKASESKDRLGLFISQHGDSFPSDEEIERLEKIALNIDMQRKRAERSAEDEALENALMKEQKLYGTLKKEQLDAVAEDAEELRKVSVDLRRISDPGKSAEYDALHQRFSKDLPSEGEINMLRSMENGIRAKELSEEVRSKEREERSSSLKKAGVGTIVAGSFLLTCAIILLFMTTAVGAVATAIALVLLVIGTIVLYQAKRENKTDASPDYLKEQKMIEDRLLSLGYEVNDRSLSLLNLSEDRKRYLELKEQTEKAKAEADELSEKQQELISRLDSFLAPYALPSCEYERKLTELKNRYQQYLQNVKTMQDRSAQRANAQKEAGRMQSELRTDLLCYLKEQNEEASEEALLKTVKQYAKDFTELSKEYISRKEDLEKYEKSVDLSAISEAEPPREGEWEELNSTLEELKKSAADDRLALENALEIAEGLAEAEDELLALEEKLKQEYDRLRILELTSSLLEDTHNELVNKYTEPVRSAYEEYALQIDPALCEGLKVMPSDMSLQFERNGELRKSSNFNSAFVVLSNVCMRLAILKVAYPEERPFLVLDDPFVYLDDENCKKALEALKKLSSDTQILYFTCHSGRTI